MKELTKITSSLLGAAILFFSRAAQSQDHTATGFLPNVPSSQILSRELEPPFSNNFVPNARFIPQPNPQPPSVTSFRQTIFTPNIRHDERSGIATVQGFPSTNPRVQSPVPVPQTSFSNFQTSFVNFQTSQFTNTPGFPAQFNPPSIQRSSQQRVPGNVNFGTPVSPTAPRTSLPTRSFLPGPIPVVNSPSPVTTQLQRATVLPQQSIAVQQQRDRAFLQAVPTPTQPVPVSSVRLSSNNEGAFSYSSDLNDSPSANPPGPAVELLPPIFEERSLPRAPENFSPVFFNPSPKSLTASRQNRFADVSTQDSPTSQEISQQGGSPTQSPIIELPPRNSLASGRALNNFVPFGQTNQISEPQQQPPRIPFNPAVNPLPTNSAIQTDSSLNLPGPSAELLPPISQDSQDGAHLRLPPAPASVKSPQTPVLQESRAGQTNLVVGQAEKAQTALENPSATDGSSGIPTAPTFPTVTNEVPPAEPQSAFESLKGSDFKVETIHPIIQDIITSVDRALPPKESSFSNPAPSGLSLDLQPPFSPNAAPLPSPIVFDFSQARENPLQISGGETSGSPPIAESPTPSSDIGVAAKPKESSPAEILSTVFTFSTPLPSISAGEPATTDSRLPPNSFSPTTTTFPSSPKTTQATAPTNPPLALDLQPPEDKNKTSPPQLQKEQNVAPPPPVPEGFVLFQPSQATPLTNQSTAHPTLTVTNQGVTDVIKPQEPLKPTIPTDVLPPSDLQIPPLTTRSGIPSNQTIKSVPQIEQGSIFPAINTLLPDQSLPVVSNSSTRTIPSTEPLQSSLSGNLKPTLSFDSEATSKPSQQTFTPSSSETSSSNSSSSLPITRTSEKSDPKKELPEDPKLSEPSAGLPPPLSENGAARNNVSSSPFLRLSDEPGTSPEPTSLTSSPFNFTTKFITNVAFSATHGPGTPCAQLDLQHKGYRAPQFGGDLLLSAGFYPTDNATNGTARQCGRTDDFDGRKFNWWQILLNHGGEPSALNGTPGSENIRVPEPTLKNPCIRPFETEGVPTYYNHTSSDLKNFYREEVAYHRFPGTPHTFLESRGLIVWRPTGMSRSPTTHYLLRYTRDDTGFWMQVKNVDCQFDNGKQPNLKCSSGPECTCEDGAEKTCSAPLLLLDKNISADANA